eukprot:UN27644
MDDSGLAPRLQPVALESNQLLVHRDPRTRDKLMKEGYLPRVNNNVSQALRPVHHVLEKKLNPHRRMSVDMLQQRGILYNKDPMVMEATEKLDKNRTSQFLNNSLQKRKDVQSLVDKGILPKEQKVAPRLQGTAKQLNSRLKRRPSQADVSRYVQPKNLVSDGARASQLE